MFFIYKFERFLSQKASLGLDFKNIKSGSNFKSISAKKINRTNIVT